MTVEDALGIARDRAWAQTKALLGPKAWFDTHTDKEVDAWTSQYHEFCNEIMEEFVASGLINPEKERLEEL